jgi:hypothetical protein
MFVSPIIVIEVEQVIKSLKSNSSAGFYKIPMFLPKKKFMLYYRAISPHQ